MLKSLQIALVALLLSAASAPVQIASAQQNQPAQSEQHEHDEKEKEGKFRARPMAPLPWGGGIEVEPIEGPTDTISFHIGSPLFLRLKLDGDIACRPFDGLPFYFDMAGAQLGWNFEEIADSTLFPIRPGDCERIVMLSSENSNRIPEGTYSLKVMIFIDEQSKLYSDTVVIRPVRSAEGANQLSYRRFLVEQLVKSSLLLHDRETVQALFAEGTPKSAESEIYRALVLYRGGDIAGAEQAIASSEEIARRLGSPIDRTASNVLERLMRVLHGDTSSK